LTCLSAHFVSFDATLITCDGFNMTDITKVDDIKPLLTQGRTDPESVFPHIERLATNEHWQTREVAATAMVEIGKRHAAVVVRYALAWAKSPDANLRRAASEGLRGIVKLDPAAVLPVIEALRCDSELYVKKSVANLLRNATAKHPDFVLEICRNWAASPNAHTRWIIKDGLRKLKITHPREADAILNIVSAATRM
jgi:3-methyladenine DNA glycosylase AlkC